MVIDDELVAEAGRALGTTTMRETVDRALTEVVRAQRRRRLAERLRTGEGMDLDALAEARSGWGAS